MRSPNLTTLHEGILLYFVSSVRVPPISAAGVSATMTRLPWRLSFSLRQILVQPLALSCCCEKMGCAVDRVCATARKMRLSVGVRQYGRDGNDVVVLSTSGVPGPRKVKDD